ncbi:hypothetical protein GCM10023116_13820 [Kistimonas scapharcae]|uniref:Transglycosylase SLT domain-containing protein n=1 Tax=Kistimonas scapharcae TaxID=1036133 RepID=A0ABP8UYU8_9GAMM
MRQQRVLTSLLLTLSLMATPKALPSGANPSIDYELRDILQATINQSDSFADRFDAEVWLVDMSSRLERFIASDADRLNLLRLIHTEATLAGLQPELVLAVIQTESAFNQFAISRVGAQGLMQVMPFWKNEIGREDDNLTQVATNLRYGCTILSYYLDKEKGNLTRALARYNGSLGKTWYPERVMTNWERHWLVR